MSKGRKRLLVVGLFLATLFCLLIVRYYQIQILEGEKWSKAAEKQHYFIVKDPFTRGVFYANDILRAKHPPKYSKLVADIEKFHLFIDPVSFPDSTKQEAAAKVSRLLNLSKEKATHLRDQFYTKSRSRKVAMWLDPKDKEMILKWWRVFAAKHKIARNALFFGSDYKRSYPFGHMLGQVLHTIQDAKEESTFQALPTGGLELFFNPYLRGKMGKQRLMRSPRNSIETGDIVSSPENGADIYLTIDSTLQTIAEEELEIGVKACKAKCGWAVMMNPHTGEILALAQYPFFHPEDYQKYFNDPLMIQHTKVKSVTDANEVGSVMKPMTVAVAFLANEELERRGEKPLFSPDEKISCASGVFPGRSKPISDTTFHRYLNMDMALQRSSNIYMARLVERIIQRLGAEWYRNALINVFGFSKKTGIELPSESPGVLPTPGKLHPNGVLEWSVPTPFSMAFGYNLQANSIQLLKASSVIANGGYLVKPSLVQKIVKEGKILYAWKENKTKVLDQKITEQVVRGMKYATKYGGTCRVAAVDRYTEAAKSSTCKKIVNGAYSEVLYIGSFIGFAPAKDPAFIVLVSMDEPEYGYVPGIGKRHNGGKCAGLVFKRIAERGLSYLGIPSDDPHNNDWVQETKQLNDLYQKWNAG